MTDAENLEVQAGRETDLESSGSPPPDFIGSNGFTIVALVGKLGRQERASEELRSKIILLTIRRDPAE